MPPSLLDGTNRSSRLRPPAGCWIAKRCSRAARSDDLSCSGMPPATPTGSATAAVRPGDAALWRRDLAAAVIVSHELLSSKHESSSLHRYRQDCCNRTISAAPHPRTPWPLRCESGRQSGVSDLSGSEQPTTEASAAAASRSPLARTRNVAIGIAPCDGSWMSKAIATTMQPGLCLSRNPRGAGPCSVAAKYARPRHSRCCAADRLELALLPFARVGYLLRPPRRHIARVRPPGGEKRARRGSAWLPLRTGRARSGAAGAQEAATSPECLRDRRGPKWIPSSRETECEAVASPIGKAAVRVAV